MVKRKLPATRNALLTPEKTPPHETLVGRRRLGQTDLHVKAGAAGINNATKPANLGIFDYAHLRVPLPHDLSESEIFTPSKNDSYPESYFLMRRSEDGYISATGMYKAAFPLSTIAEEELERKHHKSLLKDGDDEEVAGNVWIAPEDAIKLAEEYHIRPWINALLDNADIEVGPKQKMVGKVSLPPRFEMPGSEKLLPPPELAAPTSSVRAKRSVSPGKVSATPRKIASPRKRRAASNKPDEKKVEEKKVEEKKAEEKKVEEKKVEEKKVEEKKTEKKSSEKAEESKPSSPASVRKSSRALQDKVTNGAPKDHGTQASAGAEADIVRVEVNEMVETKGDREITNTKVSIEMPASHPDLPMPEDTTAMIEKAREMVQEAGKLEKKTTKSTKRKASSALEKDGKAGGSATQLAKRPRTELQERLITERVRNRALIGITATLAVGAIIPYFL